MKKKYSLILLIVTVTCFYQLTAEEIARNKYLSYADFLYESADFLRASYEYLRIFHLYKNSNRDQELLSFRIGNCFQNLGEFQKARKYFNLCVDSGIDKNMYQKSINYIGYGMFIKGDYPGSIKYLEEYNSGSNLIRNSIILGNVLCQLNQKKAQEKLNEFKQKGFKYFRNLEFFSKALGRVKYKSPLKAGILSALIPGLGKVYSKQLTEGIFSFISFCSSGYLAYEGFREDGLKSFQGWLFSSISVFLYAGNIYGAVLATKKHNHSLKLEFRNGVQLSLSLLIKKK